MTSKDNDTPRIMIVDDEESVRRMFEEVLSGDSPEIKEVKSSLQGLENDLFGGNVERKIVKKYDLIFCKQGEEAVNAVAATQGNGRPFSLIFLDMRLPPGNNGLWTAEKIRELDAEVIIVFITAYSDVDPEKISEKIKPADKLLYIQKPVHPQEIRQFADSLTDLWLENRKTAGIIENLERNYLKYENTIHAVKTTLDDEIDKHLRTQKKLQAKEKELDESTVAMKVLAKNINIDSDGMEEKLREQDRKLQFNIWELTEPFIAKLENSGLNDEQREYLQVLKKNLDNLVSPAMYRLAAGGLSLTPSETQVANLVKQGKSTKEIARLLNLGERTVEFHRNNIRQKIGIKNKRASLKTYLLAVK